MTLNISCFATGVIFDFAGPYCVNRDSMAFGAPTRYLTLEADECQDAKWDEGIAQANCIYERRMHNLWSVKPLSLL